MVAMKKTLYFLGCVALLAAGCSKVQTVEVPEEEVPQLKFNITVTRDDDTRAVKREFAVGDKIYLAFDISFVDKVGSLPTDHGYISMAYNGNRFETPVASNNKFMKALMASPSGNLAAVYMSDGRTPQFEYGEQGDQLRFLTMTNNEKLGGFSLVAGVVPYTIANNTLTADIKLALFSTENQVPVHFFLPGISASKAGNYSMRCTKMQPCRFNRFTCLDATASIGMILGPWAPVSMDPFGAPMYGSYYSSGLEFVGYLDPDVIGTPTDYYLVVVDNKGTPDNAADDVYYGMKKNSFRLDGKEAIKLPALTNWTVFTPSDIDMDYNGFNSEVIW